MKMAGMFKCLSVTEGNVALGPEVQFSMKRTTRHIHQLGWRVLSKLEWTNVIQRDKTRSNHTINNGGKCGIVSTWTYNFGTLNDTCICRVLTHCVLEERKWRKITSRGKVMPLWQQCSTGSDISKQPSVMFVQLQQCPFKICQSCTYPFINSGQ